MVYKLLEIIENEDKKNPLTDQEIAKKLDTSRSFVTHLRREAEIPPSNERRKKLLVDGVKEIIKSEKKYSENSVTEILKSMGYKVSRSQVRNIIKDIENSGDIKKSEQKDIVNKIKVSKNKVETKDGFENLIGSEGSLKDKVFTLKSAMMYPPNGLHTIIYGQSGVGKSDMAECMYNFSVRNGYKKKNSPFIVFNCADYAENPNLLITHLFGVQKGAYTGADVSKEGIVERADGGILFLDEVHRLPPTGQEILFSLIDKGVYRRLGESNAERKANVLFICATTGDPSSDLLLTFRRRIPVIVELPPLEERPKKERYGLILKFFENEARRVNKNFVISKDVMLYLMSYKSTGNIGQLKSDIQVICAKAFSKIDITDDTVYISVNSLRKSIKENTKKENFEWIEDVFIDISDVKSPKNRILSNAMSEIHQYAERQLKFLSKSEYSDEEIKNIFLGKIDKKFNELISNRKFFNKEEISSYLDGNYSEIVIDIMNKVVEVLKIQYAHINSTLYPALAIHLQHTLERIEEGKTIINPSLAKISNQMPQEFELARYISSITENISGISLPEDELGYLAYYINKFCYNEEDIDEKVKVVIATHGKVGIEMANVVNSLMGVECTIGLEVQLDYSSKEGIERCVSRLSSVNAKNGIIILIDMGSLVIIGNEIEKKYNIKTKTIPRVDTLLAMEIGKMAAIESKSFEEISDYYDSLKIQDRDEYMQKKESVNAGKHKASSKDMSQNKLDGAYKGSLDNKDPDADLEKDGVIVSVCLSGYGNAVKLKQVIEQSMNEKNIEAEVIPIGFFDDVDAKLSEIEKNKKIYCIVGTMEIDYKDIPFINYQDVMSGKRLGDILRYFEKRNEKSFVKLGDGSDIENIVKEDYIFYNYEGISKEYIVDSLVAKLQEDGYVDSNFILSVYKRESMGTLVYNKKIAIPHGLPENVIKPVVAIAKLSKPIIWDNEFMVDFVILIALKEYNQREIKNIFNILSKEENIKLLTESESKKDIYDIFTK